MVHLAASASASPAMPSGLRYVSDATPGITRHKKGEGFVFHHADGTLVKKGPDLARITHLAIPPAYVDVWICPKANGHLQATGRDARGRKQYLYHPAWRTAQDETKFDRMLAFGAALPKLRARVTRDLGTAKGPHIERATVMAAVVRLLDTTMVRVGNDEYARSNQSFGLTTLRKRHVAVNGDHLRLRFKGKSGVAHDVALKDKRIARVVKGCQSLPGQELFKYLDADGQAHSVNSSDVNDYLRDASSGDFTAKDFRTWHGSAAALGLFKALGDDERAAITKTVANRLVTEVAQLLGNTAAVCRKSYIHPQVMALLMNTAVLAAPRPTAVARRRAGLTVSDAAFLAFLKRLK